MGVSLTYLQDVGVKIPCARLALFPFSAKRIAPKRRMKVSEWADVHMVLSSKTSAEPGRWQTSRNPHLKEVMDCFSVGSRTRDVICMFPVQIGKSEVMRIIIGYYMTQDPCSIMAAFPADVSLAKFKQQKLDPMLEDVGVCTSVLTTTNSRNAKNQAEFKDYLGGVLMLEHAGSTARLKSSSVRLMLVDELDEFSQNLRGGFDALTMLRGRVSAYPNKYRMGMWSTPGIEGASVTQSQFEKSDQRHRYVPCPHCGTMQTLQWDSLHYTMNEDGEAKDVFYVCEEGCVIHEHEKTAMFEKAEWRPHKNGRKMRGYTLNCLYYPVGLGPSWASLAEEYEEALKIPEKLRVFYTDRLAVPYRNPDLAALSVKALQEQAMLYDLREIPQDGLIVTAGVDTQDNRLAVQLVAWGRGLSRFWVIDYVELMGNPSQMAVWAKLTKYLKAPLRHESGAQMTVQAAFIDAGGHKTEEVKRFCRTEATTRTLPIFGSNQIHAPIISKPRTWEPKSVTQRPLTFYHLGVNKIKDILYKRMAHDLEENHNDQQRQCNYSKHLEREYFTGLLSEVFDEKKKRYIAKQGVRNEPLDTLVYAFAATHHPTLNLQLATDKDWDRQARLIAKAAEKQAENPSGTVTEEAAAPTKPQQINRHRRRQIRRGL